MHRVDEQRCGWGDRQGCIGEIPGHRPGAHAFRTLYVLALIELGSRRIHVSPATAHPDSAWVTSRRETWLSGSTLAPPSPVPHPGPGREVHGAVRRGPALGGDPGHPNADPGTERQRLRGTGDRDDPGRVPRLDAHPRSATSRSDAPDLRRALQSAATSPCRRPGSTAWPTTGSPWSARGMFAVGTCSAA
jgi:hypothetical protein